MKRLLAAPWWVLGALGVLLIMGSFGGLVHYSESPSFCKSCHIMEPYYQAWKTSRHNFVACVECHYPPGSPRTLLWKKFQALSQVAKYVTKTYSSRPFAEIEDNSCLRSGCHSRRLLQGRVLSPKGIKFDHRPHLMQVQPGRQLRCVSCHSQIVVGKHVEVTYDTCYLCHFKGMGEGRDLKPLGGCLGCHELPSKSFAIGNMTYNHKDFVTRQGVSCRNCHLDVLRGSGQAPQERCFTCHNQPEKLARYGDIPSLHENHVAKHNVACFHCHQEMRHGFGEASARLASLGEPAPPVSTAPASGHPPTLAFDCSFCHQGKHAGQIEMYTGRARSLGLPEMPSPMFLAQVDCVGCHYQEASPSAEFKGRTFKASEKACVKCHGERFAGIWEETRSELKATLAKLEEKLSGAAKTLDSQALPAGEKKRISGLLARARRLHGFVRDSRGEHNIYLASTALRQEDEALTRAGEGLKAQLPDLSSMPLLSGGFCASLCHSKVGVKVPPETVTAFGKDMPHAAHAGMMGCAECHRIGGHKSVPLREGIKEKCLGCHPPP